VTLQRVLVFHNAGFEADVAALTAAAPPGIELRTFSTEQIGAHFLRLFPRDVLGLDYTLFHRPELAGRRSTWARRARDLVADLYGSFPFDVAVAPADDTPYWRDVALGIEELGSPFVVLYKETTQPPHQLIDSAEILRRYVPPTARHYLANSTATARYLTACGARADSIEVIGQPRFDVYHEMTESTMPPRILFLSYQAYAYRTREERSALDQPLEAFYKSAAPAVPATWPDPIGRTWLPLRCATERGILEFAARRDLRVVIKPHPQMTPADVAFDRGFVASTAASFGVDVRYADGREDIRTLLAASSIVVGFQTTALLEAMAAGRQVVYAAWGEDLAEHEERLIPFGRWGDVIGVARSPASLLSALAACHPTDPLTTARGRSVAEEWLGPLDGQASVRAWQSLSRIVSERQVSHEERARAEHAIQESQSTRGKDALMAEWRERIWYALGLLADALRAAPGARRMKRVFERLHERAAARRLERAGSPPSREIAGPFDAPLAVEFVDLVRIAAQRAHSALR
jgi:hypothetical protein